jgi:DNA repair protein SbcD/Mre11
MTRIFHTSDWHLGKKLFKVDRFEEHQYFLEWMLKTLKEHDTELLIIAGDIFDVQSPPHSAIKQFFSFLKNLLAQTNTTVVIISGNHDSATLVESPSALLDSSRIIIKGEMSFDPQEHIVEIDLRSGKTISLSLLPYFRNYEIARWAKHYKIDNVDAQDENIIIKTIEAWLESSTISQKKADYNFLVAHHLFGEFMSGDSEYGLSLTGINTIPLELFKDLDYICLGHIHKYQKISSTPPAYYTGSPIAFRFSENNKKRLNLIKLGESLEIETIEIPTLKDLAVIKTTILMWREDVEKLVKSAIKPTFLEVQIRLKDPVIGLADEIRELLEHTKIELLSLYPTFESADSQKEQDAINVNDISIEEHFKNYYLQKFPESNIKKEVLREFRDIISLAQLEDQQL